MTFPVIFQKPTPRNAPWWQVAGVTCVAAYQPKGAASYAASKINLANPGTNDAVEGTAPTWTTESGWAFNGVSWLNTGVSAAALTYSMLVQFTGYAGSSSLVIAGATQGGTAGFYIQHAGTNVRYYNGPFVDVAPTFPVAGNLAIAGKQPYRNGIAEGTIPAGGTAPGISIYLGGVNSGGAIGNRPVFTMTAVAIYNNTLNAAQAASLAIKMAAL